MKSEEREMLNHSNTCGVRRQSEAATALWIFVTLFKGNLLNPKRCLPTRRDCHRSPRLVTPIFSSTPRFVESPASLCECPELPTTWCRSSVRPPLADRIRSQTEDSRAQLSNVAP